MWRPDSRRLAYIWRAAVYTVDADGENTRRVSGELVNLRYLSWAPDGRRLGGYIRADATSAIHVLDTVTGVLTRVTSGQPHAWVPAWSPTAARIVCNSLDGEGAELVTLPSLVPGLTVQLLPRGSGWLPAWAPDGQSIAVTRADGLYNVIDILDLSGRRVRELSGGRGVQGGLAWSPDGSRIAFARWTYGSYDIWTVNVDTGEERRLTSSDYSDTSPSWAP